MAEVVDVHRLEFLVREYEVCVGELCKELAKHEDIPNMVLVALGMVAVAIEETWGHEDA